MKSNYLVEIDELRIQETCDAYFKWKDLITDINFFRGMIDDIEFDYNVSINGNINTMSNEFDYICEEYFNWLAEGLSMYGRVSRQDIFNKLNELILK